MAVPAPGRSSESNNQTYYAAGSGQR
jgi:hypothetical protein